MAAQQTFRQITDTATHQATRRLLDAAIDEFPPFPIVATKVLESTNSDNACASDIEKILAADQALAAKILRTANSAFFGMPNRVSSLNQAVMLLGFSQIRSIVISVATASLFRTSSPGVRERQHGMWRHAFGTGCALREMVPICKLNVTADVAFTGGLLTGIGSLFLLHAFTGQFLESEKIAATKEISQAEAECYLFGVHHATVAKMLAIKWNLPTELISIIGEHEGPFDEASPLTLASKLSDDLAFSIASEVESPPPFVDRLGLSLDQIAAVRLEVTTQIAATTEFLGLG